MVTSSAVQTVGGRSAHRRFPIERLFTEMRTYTLMLRNADRALQLIGQDVLGIEDQRYGAGSLA